MLLPGAAYSLPNPMSASAGMGALPGHAASLGGPFVLPPDPLLMQQATGAYEGSSGCWEGMGPGRSPPGSVSGLAGGSSPSAVLFKGLLRGIVLYEGYRFVRVCVSTVERESVELLITANLAWHAQQHPHMSPACTTQIAAKLVVFSGLIAHLFSGGGDGVSCDRYVAVLLQGFLAAEQSLFMPLLLLGATLAVAGGLPFLLLPASLLRSSASSSGSSKPDTAQHDGIAAAAAAAGRRRMRSPFSDAASGKSSTVPAETTSSSSSSSGLGMLWGYAQDRCALVWSRVVSVLVRADRALRSACASSFLDTAVSGLIVVGLILGSVVLSAVLLVQIGDESRQVGGEGCAFRPVTQCASYALCQPNPLNCDALSHHGLLSLGFN
jgi:hypothetical protein